MNLLPKTEKDLLKKGLKHRSIIILMIAISASFAIGIIMLVPSYFLISGLIPGTAESQPEKNDSRDEILNLPEEINQKLNILRQNINQISVKESLSRIIGYMPKEISLNSISFSRNQAFKGQSGTVISISGVAADRDSLVSFTTLLRESNAFAGVDMPVSSLAKGSNLPFSMNIFIEN